jgi:hypothetical protein
MINDAKPGEKCGLCYARELSPYAWSFVVGMTTMKLIPDYAWIIVIILILPMLAPIMSDYHSG